jgi:hypothetical protein
LNWYTEGIFFPLSLSDGQQTIARKKINEDKDNKRNKSDDYCITKEFI